MCHELHWRCSIFTKQGVRVNMWKTKRPRLGWSKTTQSNTANIHKSQSRSPKTQLSLLVKGFCTWGSSRVTWEVWCKLRELDPALGIRKYVVENHPRGPATAVQGLPFGGHHVPPCSRRQGQTLHHSNLRKYMLVFSPSYK